MTGKFVASPRGVHRVESRDATVAVDLDDAELRLDRHSFQLRPAHERQRDDAVHWELSAARDNPDQARADIDLGRGDELDRGRSEQPGHGGARALAEDRERARFGRDEAELARQRPAGRMLRGQERELVQRQRPAGHRRRDEGDPPHASLLEVIEQRPHGRAAPGAGERHRVVERGQQPRPGREHRRVEGQRVAAAQHDQARAAVNGRDGGLHQTGADVVGDPPQRMASRLAEPERLGHRHRPIDEIQLVRDELRADPIAGPVAQGHQGFQSGDAAANDQHLGRRPGLGHSSTLRPPRETVNIAGHDALDRTARRVYNGRPPPPNRIVVHARVSSYEGDVDRLLDGFERQADLVRGLEGFSPAYLFVDRPGGRAMIVSLWDSEEALDASASRAAHLRKEAAETAGATIGSVESYELARTIDGGR